MLDTVTSLDEQGRELARKLKRHASAIIAVRARSSYSDARNEPPLRQTLEEEIASGAFLVHAV